MPSPLRFMSGANKIGIGKRSSCGVGIAGTSAGSATIKGTTLRAINLSANAKTKFALKSESNLALLL